MAKMFNMCKPSTTPLKGHSELRNLVDAEERVVKDINNTEMDRMDARSAFQAWSQGRSDDLNRFGDILHDSFREQRTEYRQYYLKSDDLIRALRKALEEEKFLDPTKNELQKREKMLTKTEKDVKRKYDRATNTANFEYKSIKYDKKVARAELRRDQAHRMVDTAHDIYDKEDKRITSATKHDVIVGYLSIMKQDYVLMRSRIQELERVFDVVRDHFPGEECDLPKEKLTPILKISQERVDETQRQKMEAERAKQPRFTLEQAVAAALPAETKGSGIASPGPQKHMPTSNIQMIASSPKLQGMSGGTRPIESTGLAPAPPPVPSQDALNVASRHQLMTNA